MVIIAAIAVLIIIIVFCFCMGLSSGFELQDITCYSFEAQELLKKNIPCIKLVDKKQIPKELDYLRLSKINGYEKELAFIANKLCNRGCIENHHEKLYDGFKKHAPDYNCAIPIFYVKDLFCRMNKLALYSKDFRNEYLSDFINLCKELDIPESENYTCKIITETISDVFHIQSIKELMDFVFDFGFNSHVYFFAGKQKYCNKILVSMTNKVECLHHFGNENENEIKKLGNLLSKIPILPLHKSKKFYHLAEIHFVETNSGKFIERIDFNPKLSNKDIECEISKFVLPVFQV